MRKHPRAAGRSPPSPACTSALRCRCAEQPPRHANGPASAARCGHCSARARSGQAAVPRACLNPLSAVCILSLSPVCGCPARLSLRVRISLRPRTHARANAHVCQRRSPSSPSARTCHWSNHPLDHWSSAAQARARAIAPHGTGSADGGPVGQPGLGRRSLPGASAKRPRAACRTAGRRQPSRRQGRFSGRGTPRCGLDHWSNDPLDHWSNDPRRSCCGRAGRARGRARGPPRVERPGPLVK